MRRFLVYGAMGTIALCSQAVADDSSKTGRDVHPPTEIMSSEIPKLKSDGQSDMHPPTAITGAAVPEMKAN